jgi:SRSO17 transposase
MEWTLKLWQESTEQFQQFLAPLTRDLGRSERRVAATRYIEGLLIPGERKSMEPMAARLGVDKQSLQQFISDSPWSDQDLWSSIRREVIPHMTPLEALIVDETGWVKQGKESVGVSPQYCGAVGKKANCQVSVEVVVSDGWVAAPIGGRLYLPQSWTADRERCARAGVPGDVKFATKPMLAIEIIKDALRDNVPAAPVLGDAVYGDNLDFRAALRGLQLEFFLQVDPRKHRGWDREVCTTVKRIRRHVNADAPPARTLAEIGNGLPKDAWKNCSWTTAGGQTQTTRIAWCQVFLQEGLHRPGGDLEKVWLVIDWPAGDKDPYHYYLAHFHRPPTLAHCVRLSRSRWHVEQYFQRSKTDLGLDHFEGRSWRGFHHHLVLSAVAYIFILTLYLRRKKNFWCDVGTDTPPDPTVVGEIARLLRVLPQQICPGDFESYLT